MWCHQGKLAANLEANQLLVVSLGGVEAMLAAMEQHAQVVDVIDEVHTPCIFQWDLFSLI